VPGSDGVASVAGGTEARLEILFLAPLRAHLNALLPGGHRAVLFLVLQRQLEPVLAPARGLPGHDDHLVTVDRAGGNDMLVGLAPAEGAGPISGFQVPVDPASGIRASDDGGGRKV